MGDTGSLIIGMILAILTIEFLNENSALPTTSPVRFESSVGAAICVMIIPLVDTLRVIMIRIYKGVSPLTPDKRHIHHALVRLGKSHRMAVSIVCMVHILFLTALLVLRHVSDIYLIGFILVMATSLCVILDRLINRHTFNKAKPVSPKNHADTVH